MTLASLSPMKTIALGLLLLLGGDLFAQEKPADSAADDSVREAYSPALASDPRQEDGQLAENATPGALPLAGQVYVDNPEFDKRLHSILQRLKTSPDDDFANAALETLVNELIVEVEASLSRMDWEAAERYLFALEALRPGRPALSALRIRLDDARYIENELEMARQAMQHGRVELPNTGSALYHYRRILDLDPANKAATEGVQAVQQNMIDRALQFARDLDFESALSVLKAARTVREQPELIQKASRQVTAIRMRRESDLETLAIQQMDAGEFRAAERTLIDLVALGGARESLVRLRRRLEEARVYGGFTPGEIIRDHFLNQARWTPDLVIIAAGSFVMGSPSSEDGRLDNEGPQHRVTFRRGFAMGVHEITVAEFGAFVESAHYFTAAQRSGSSTVYDQTSGRLTKRDQVSWKLDFEGREARGGDPVVHVSWNDVKAYTDWLSRGTGKVYRLPSESEFEYAMRGGRTTRFWWGNGIPDSMVENLTGDQDSSRNERYWSTGFKNYRDGFWGPAPAGSFIANPFGLFDIGGNVAEWVEDCWHETYLRAPLDGGAWVNPGCAYRVVRGGYWASSPDQTRSAFRLSALPDAHDGRVGFRIVRDL